MRPCSQCKRPVENSVHVCADCEAYNREHGLEPPRRVATNTEVEDDSNQPAFRDLGMDVMSMAFYLSAAVICALVGYLINTWAGLAIGGMIGFLVGISAIRLLIQ